MSEPGTGNRVVYCQINKDYAYWTEKRRVGQKGGGHVAGLLTQIEEGQVKQNILIDCGLGTLEGIADACDDTFWDQPLAIWITHGHIDHHAELMILSEIYCKRRGKNNRDKRPALPVLCTADTQKHLFATHRYGYAGGATLAHRLLTPNEPVACGVFNITPLAVDHFEGAVIFLIEFGSHKILIAWDMTTLPFTPRLRGPSLTFVEATTWTPRVEDTGHTSITELVESGFLKQLQLEFDPAREKYGAYLVHYSGWEDPWGMMTDAQLKEKFNQSFPGLAQVVRVAERGQRWDFRLD